LKQIADQIEALMKEMQAQGLKTRLLTLELPKKPEKTRATISRRRRRSGSCKPGEKGVISRQAVATARGQGDAGGGGQNPSGQVPDAPAPREGEATQLEVILQQEELVAPLEEEKMQEIEEQSKQERSKLDYRNVTSELTPAQRDALNQDSIPWEYRQLIKQYFEAIRPQQNK
jgi:hypothetical protein